VEKPRTTIIENGGNKRHRPRDPPRKSWPPKGLQPTLHQAIESADACNPTEGPLVTADQRPHLRRRTETPNKAKTKNRLKEILLNHNKKKLEYERVGLDLTDPAEISVKRAVEMSEKVCMRPKSEERPSCRLRF